MAISDPDNLEERPFWTVRRVVIAALVAVTLGMAGYAYWRFRTIGIPLAPLPMGQYEPSEILVRAKSNESDAILIGVLKNDDKTFVTRGLAEPVPSGPIYRFTPEARRLELVDLDEWRAATGPITFRYFDRLRSGSLKYASFRASGAYSLDIDVSPDRKYVNVVSANARKGKGNFMFFLGGGGGAYPRGPFYHETFDRLTGMKVGPTYTLEYPGERVNLSYCWEAQGKYVVYHDMQGRFLWIVPGPGQLGAQSPFEPTSTADLKSKEKTNG